MSDVVRFSNESSLEICMKIMMRTNLGQISSISIYDIV